jgi:hypothetical protein
VSGVFWAFSQGEVWCGGVGGGCGAIIHSSHLPFSSQVMKEQSTSNKVIVDIFRLRKEGRNVVGLLFQLDLEEGGIWRLDTSRWLVKGFWDSFSFFMLCGWNGGLYL